MEKYIHFTSFNIEKINSIFKYGILNKHNLKKIGFYPKKDADFNGEYFISLTKESDIKVYSSFYHFYNDSNYIGIEVNKPKIIYKTNNELNDIKFCLFHDTIFPVRYSAYPDEWQTNLKIRPNNFTAIKYRIEKFELKKEKLDEIESLINEYNLDIPIIDFDTNKVYKKEAK